MLKSKRKTQEERFWSKVRVGSPEECWTIASSTNGKGYVQVWYKSKKVLAHRLALQLHLGRPLADGMQACHTCDNRICCNWHHLWEGTTQQNTQDKMNKGRHMSLSGELCPNSKLKDLEVRQIRSLYATGNYSAAMLGRMFGCASSTVWTIVNRLTWKHLD